MARTDTARPHRWRFFRAGGVDQVRLDRGADIRELAQLDKKLWVALSCPVKGIELDERTLELLDADGDGRVRAPEVLEAIAWVDASLDDLDLLVEERDGVPLAKIDDGKESGRALLGAARLILGNLGKADAAEITVADASEATRILKEAARNGDGVIPPAALEDAAAKKLVEDLVACLGGEKDRSGKKGASAKSLAAFFDELSAFESWWAAGEKDDAVMPLGADTPAAVAAFEAVRGKIDDYFARCRLAAYDADAQAALGGPADRYVEAASGQLSATAVELEHLPLQVVEADRPLTLDRGVHPAWSGRIQDLTNLVVKPMLGDDHTTLSEEEWREIGKRLGAHLCWRAGEKGGKVADLGIARVRELLGGKARALVEKAIEEDEALADEAKATIDVERLARYVRDLHKLLVNFVSFEDFYSRRRPAVFQAGTLYLDGRSCDLCVDVADPAKHGLLAGLAKSYLVYCELTRPSGEKRSIAAAFTAGDSDHLMVGRNGIFFDRRGRDWDATITKIVDNPISIRQAFWAPYKRVLRWIEESAAKRAAAADTAATGKLQAAAAKTGEAAATGAAPAEKPKFDIGTVAALGVAVGGITAAFGMLLEAFFGLGKWIPIGIVGIILAISGPSMIIAWLKLRQRNLGPILDANGWAVNGRAKVNVPLGTSLTARAVIPSGSERSYVDPFAEKKSLWPRLLLVLIVVGLAGWGLHRWEVEPVKGWIDRGIAWVKGTPEAQPVKPAPGDEGK